ncbi:MAG: flavodoxin-dependent (E)-4-hydroxy-3-methylbut-2-enyl-diphosphate synthase [Spirochaetes bacterium]|nr:flavodoxin-dependent (E)-4-hydroxy-3-methylbut-2-enyl-diphosphate synthase [Spirochaetota bacterium]
MMERKKTRRVMVGSVPVGGGAPVSIQSMTSVPTEDAAGTIAQIGRLAAAGAEIVRVAVRSLEAAGSLGDIIAASPVPVAADIHFDYRIALAAIRAGVHKVRLNPGNIGGTERVREVVAAARERGVPIRIGVNAGSLDRRRFPHPSPENMVESAMEHVRILEAEGFADIIVSLKSSDVRLTVEANRLFSRTCDYPLHLGLTEAGYGTACIVNSAVAIGTLLMEGIGDTVRVSMTGDPAGELPVARGILEASGERRAAIRMVSCPTCGRTDPDLDLLSLAREIEESLRGRYEDALTSSGRSITVAVMGCEVNGPGEALEADVGVAGGRGGFMLLFSRGERKRRITRGEAAAAVLEEVARILERGE